MSAQDKIVSSVQKLLGYVDKLKADKDDSEVHNPPKAAYLQSLIFQKFALIDALLRSCPKAEEVIEAVVSLKRAEVKSEAEDLKDMPVPRLVTAETVKEWNEDKMTEMRESFPYLNLPPEVRKLVLKQLTSPDDKLSFTRTLPTDALMMGWHENALLLEMVLPILYKVNIDNPLESSDLIKLCHSSREAHAAVKNSFEQSLVSAFFDVCQQIRTIDPTDYNLNPLPLPIQLIYGSPTEEEEDDQNPDNVNASKLDQIRILREIGKNIWSLAIRVRNMSPRQALELVRDCLELTPNLRCLHLSVDLVENEESTDGDNLEHLQLPELARLRYLKFWGVHHAMVGSKFLEKYRSVITGFHSKRLYDMPLVPVDNDETRYPLLTFLTSADQTQRSVDIVVSKLNSLVGSPLKRIKLNMGWTRGDARDFRNLMCSLSQFGESLEELKVRLSPRLDFVEDESTDLSWLADVHFPKVKRLCLNDTPHTLYILLRFPALEQLSLFCIEPRRCHGKIYKTMSGKNLNLSQKLEDMYVSNIWKMMPFLKKIQVPEFEVTRSECLAYQRKLAEIKKEFGHVNITISGPICNGVSQTDDDAGLVIDCDVEGDVIQEGGGRILVNGKVEGKIEQNGDGKIFIRGKHYGTLTKTGNGVVVIDWGNVKR